VTLRFTLLRGFPVDPFDTGFVEPGKILFNGFRSSLVKGSGSAARERISSSLSIRLKGKGRKSSKRQARSGRINPARYV
jgi:hypothetical protein